MKNRLKRMEDLGRPISVLSNIYQVGFLRTIMRVKGVG